jgi:hypothetical protein
MSAAAVVLQGVVTPDGTLQLGQKVQLPAGPVRVTVQSLEPPAHEDIMAILGRIWAAQKAGGHVPRSREAIDAELNALRDEAEEELKDLERSSDPDRRTAE